MTKKRFHKLLRAYFTRLNAWGSVNGHKPLKMGELYRSIPNIQPNNMTRAEWWELISKGENFGVGVKE